METTYFVRFKTSYKSIPKANESLKFLKENFPELDIELGYYRPQPRYKSWVPNWVLRLIIKNN